MAEMYGEVIEFNDRLHQQLVQKNSVIIRLAHTLITTGIEVWTLSTLSVLQLISARFEFA